MAAARQTIQSLGLYGRVTAEPWTGERLPYVDNLVNLVVADHLGKLPMQEVLRVLAPGGVALISGKKIVKPRPKEMDEWQQHYHNADNNAVARDELVGPPTNWSVMVGFHAGESPMLCTFSENDPGSPAVMLTGPPFSSVSSGSTTVIGPDVPGSPGRSVATLPSMMLYVYDAVFVNVRPATLVAVSSRRTVISTTACSPADCPREPSGCCTSPRSRRWATTS